MKNCILKINENVMIKASEGKTLREAAKTYSEFSELRENFDDGFFICDLGEVARLYHWWNVMFPRIRPFYAIKVAPHPPLMAVLAAFGAAFDSAGKEETDLALECGASPEDIIFTHPHKKLSNLEHSRKKNIRTLVFDDEGELNKLKKTYPEANLLLRIKADGAHSLAPMAKKFGATMETSYDLLRKAKELEMNVIGVCFHVGSYCLHAIAYTKPLQEAKKLFDFAKTLGMNFTVLDIGGGFTASRTLSESIEKMAVKINSDIDELFPIEQHKDLKIIAEPGRYFCATAFTLATSVISKKAQSRFDNVDAEYTLTDGIHGALQYLSGNYPGECIPFAVKNGEKSEEYARIWGPTCDNDDVVSERVLVPKVEAGDWLFFRNAGAYTFAVKTNFNGFNTDTIYNIISKENEKIFWTLCKNNIQRLNENE